MPSTAPKAEYGALAMAIAAFLSATAPQISPSLDQQTLHSVLKANAIENSGLILLGNIQEILLGLKH
ncbi:MAG: hypothetical protein ACOC3E_02360 [Cyanobacteriota bacterium]